MIWTKKEPAPSANDASSQVENEVLPIINDTTFESKCQEPGINAAGLSALFTTMLDETYGRECELTGIKADKDQMELTFSFKGKEYYIVFGQVHHYDYPSGGDKT